MVNDIVARPDVAKLFDTHPRIIKGLHRLYKMETSVTLHFVDAKGECTTLRLRSAYFMEGQSDTIIARKIPNVMKE